MKYLIASAGIFLFLGCTGDASYTCQEVCTETYKQGGALHSCLADCDADNKDEP